MKKLFTTSAMSLALLGANQALAGGLWLNDYGDFAAGRASAGAVAGVDEASTIIHNPASATGIEGSQLFLSGGVFIPDVKFDVESAAPILGSDNGGDAGLVAPGAGFAYVHDTGSDKWSAGIYLAGLSGAGLEYNDHWVGRYQSTDVELILMVLAPTIAYRVTDKLSLGVGGQFYYSDLEMKLRVPDAATGQPDSRVELDGDDTGGGFTLGATYDFSNRTSLGISYQSKLEIEYGGGIDISSSVASAGTVESNTELTMAPKVRVGLHHDLSDRFGVNFTVGWDGWSELDQILISVSGAGGAAGLDKGWDDTYHYAWGFSYLLDSKWEITSGVSYDTNPVSAHDRTADLPIDRQVRLNAGARKQFSDSLTMGGSFSYMDMGSARISGEFWSGEYENNAILAIAVYANWRL
jgi:long-chain fatty acid transport protein